jgi:hypothetical protein
MSDTPVATPEERKRHLDVSSPEKTVSAKAQNRLNLAADAIAATKRAIAHQGNQTPSLQATKMNSKYRLQAMRDPRAWEYTPEARSLASKNQEADVAAKADLAHGGNCGEHSWVAYHYLREHAAGEVINRVAPSWIDHAFVILGDLKKDKDNELVVSDPWVNKPMACLWEDNAFNSGPREDLNARTMVADGNSYKSAIAAGLKLSAYGLKLIQQSDTEEQTDQQVGDWKANHFWNQDDTRSAQFHYKPEQPQAQAGQPGQQDSTRAQHQD